MRGIKYGQMVLLVSVDDRKLCASYTIVKYHSIGKVQKELISVKKKYLECSYPFDERSHFFFFFIFSRLPLECNRN